MEYTVGVATESQCQKGLWGYGGVAAGTGGAKRGEKFLPVGNNGKRDKVRGNVA